MEAELRKLAANLLSRFLSEGNPDLLADDLGQVRQVVVGGNIGTESMLCNSGGARLESRAYGV